MARHNFPQKKITQQAVFVTLFSKSRSDSMSILVGLILLVMAAREKAGILAASIRRAAWRSLGRESWGAKFGRSYSSKILVPKV